MNRKHMILVAAAGVAILAAGAWFALSHNGESAMSAADGRKVLYWHDPMVPGYKSDKPGKSPFMDMQMVPVYEDEAGGAAVVSVRPEVIQTLGVRTYKVERTARPRHLTAEGYLFRDAAGGLSALVDIFDRDADWVRAGLPAEVRLADLPGRRFEAQVASVGSDLDIGARSLKARVRLKQSDPALKPNMFAEVAIEASPAGKKLFVPREALIRTGTRTAVVLALGDGRFRPADVVPGPEHGDWIEVVKGLNEGDTVVASGQFLIDSEASVRASFARMEPAAPMQSTADESKR